MYASPYEDPTALACPICGGNNLHLTGAHGDSGDAEVSFTCEGGDHPFDLRMHFHKGAVFFSVVPTEREADILDRRIVAAEAELARLRQERSYLGA